MPFNVPANIFGLPSHALLVHAAVVLVPLAAIALAATGWRADWRERYAFAVAGLALVGGGFAFLAKQSGSPLRNAIRAASRTAGTEPSFGGHPGQGDRAFLASVFFALAALAYWATTKYRARANLSTWAPAASYVVAASLGGLATALMIVAGHSGAALVWRDVGTYAGQR